jgi:hypothetical protein
VYISSLFGNRIRSGLDILRNRNHEGGNESARRFEMNVWLEPQSNNAWREATIWEASISAGKQRTSDPRAFRYASMHSRSSGSVSIALRVPSRGGRFSFSLSLLELFSSFGGLRSSNTLQSSTLEAFNNRPTSASSSSGLSRFLTASYNWISTGSV